MDLNVDLNRMEIYNLLIWIYINNFKNIYI